MGSADTGGLMGRAEQIAALEAKAKAIQDRARKLKAQEKASQAKGQRQADTHRKVVLGAVIIELLRRGVIDERTYGSWLDAANLSDRDRGVITHPGILQPAKPSRSSDSGLPPEAGSSPTS